MADYAQRILIASGCAASMFVMYQASAGLFDRIANFLNSVQF